MLTVEQMQRIMIDIQQGKPISVKGKEAQEFAKEVEQEMKEIEEDGMVVEFPTEWDVT